MENENQTPEILEVVGDLVAVSSEHPVLLQYKKQIEDLQAQIERTNTLVADKDTLIYRLRDKYNTHENQLEAVLKELLDDEEIELDVAKRIADIFDAITLTKHITIQYDITATATLEVPYGADPDDVASSCYVERVEFYTDFEDAEVLESEHDTNDWRDVS
jgi:hypothetical protein